VRARNLKLSFLPVLALTTSALLALALSGGEASADGRDAGGADAGARDTGPPISKTPPDPPPMTERQQWVFDLRWDRGDIYLVEVHKVDMAGPHQTPRVMGRFALELFEGPTVIERVRFDFPMLGAGPEPSDAGLKAPPRFEPKLRTRIGVLFPATKRGTKLELWDRATNVRMPLPWPPTEGPAGSDAGTR
jgi:hypothetical protein